MYLLEELFSPLITPLILCVKFREKAQEIVEFFHNFTVEVVGVGDVCSFAQMDIRKHGNPTVRIVPYLLYIFRHKVGIFSIFGLFDKALTQI